MHTILEPNFYKQGQDFDKKNSFKKFIKGQIIQTFFMRCSKGSNQAFKLFQKKNKDIRKPTFYLYRILKIIGTKSKILNGNLSDQMSITTSVLIVRVIMQKEF